MKTKTDEISDELKERECKLPKLCKKCKSMKKGLKVNAMRRYREKHK